MFYSGQMLDLIRFSSKLAALFTINRANMDHKMGIDWLFLILFPNIGNI